MAKTKHGLQETKGVFQIRGVVNGTDKENFYNEIVTKTDKDMRLVNFGLEVDDGKLIYLNMNGIVRDLTYFSKRDDEGKFVVEKVAWDKRKTFDKEGYNLIGTRVGLTKDDDGRNIQESLVEYDACKKVNQLMKDGMSIFTKGQIEFSSYESKTGKRRSVKFIPQQLSLCSRDIDFEDEDFEVKSDFSQQIVFMGIEKSENAEHFIVSAKIITYSSIEDAEFIIKDSRLANMFKQKLKPYNAIQVYGNITVIENTTEVEDDDVWGEEDPTQNLNAPTRRDFVITGAKGNSLDTDTYTQKSIEEAIAKQNQTSSAKEDWGTTDKVKDVEDEEW